MQKVIFYSNFNLINREILDMRRETNLQDAEWQSIAYKYFYFSNNWLTGIYKKLTDYC